MPICFKCKHYNGINDDTGRYYCKAFPDGIPDDILFAKFDHICIHPDQENNIVFEPIGEE